MKMVKYLPKLEGMLLRRAIVIRTACVRLAELLQQKSGPIENTSCGYSDFHRMNTSQLNRNIM